MKRNQKGFTLIEGLLIVLVLAVVGFGGYYVWHNQNKPNSTSSTSAQTTSTSTAPAPTLAQAVTLTQTAYDAWTKAVTTGQTLQAKSQWAKNNTFAGLDLQLINNNKSWFTTSFVSKANNYEATNTLPQGGEFFACTSGIAYYNGDAKATGNQLNGQTATVTVTYTDGNPGHANISYSIPVTLKVSGSSWVIDSIDLSSCNG